MNRRQLTHAAPLAWLAAAPGTAAAWNPGQRDYDAAVQQIWHTRSEEHTSELQSH